jgi:hypothetical protein
MKALLNTNLFSIIHVGMYDSYLSPESMFDDYQINEDFENGDFDMSAEDFWEKFDNEMYTKAVRRIADNFLSGEIEAEGIKMNVEVGELYSPKYYNFATDNVELTVDFDKEQVLKYAEQNKEQFDIYLKENYSSYDGFTSFTANNYFEWAEDFKNDNVQAIGAILSYLFRDEMESYQNDFLEACMTNLFYSEFI